MSRWFALLGVLLLAGCGGDPSSGARAYRTSSLPPAPSAPEPATQLAAAPQPATPPTPVAAAPQPVASAAPLQLSALSPDGSSFVTADPSSSADTAPAADAAPASGHPASSRPMQLAAQAAAPAATAAPAAAKAPKPAPYEKSVAAYLKRYALDPASLQQAKIGKPFPGTVNGRSGSIVCVELKSAQGSGAFRTAYLLQKDTVVDSQYNASACQDQKLEPWTVAD